MVQSMEPIPIVLNKDGSFNSDSFVYYMTNLIKQLKEEKLALAFAFLVFDFSNYTINQILKNEDYWNSLHVISGRYLSIFYINSQSSFYMQKKVDLYLETVEGRELIGNDASPFFKSSIYKEPTPEDNALAFVKDKFKVNNDINLPFVIFFQTNEDQITDSFIVGLKEDRLEEAFLELKFHIENAVKAISEVKSEYYGNHQEIFNLLKNGIEGGKFNKFIKKNVTSHIDFWTIISFVKKIAVII